MPVSGATVPPVLAETGGLFAGTGGLFAGTGGLFTEAGGLLAAAPLPLTAEQPHTATIPQREATLV
jgi:hypothetical protein